MTKIVVASGITDAVSNHIPETSFDTFLCQLVTVIAVEGTCIVVAKRIAYTVSSHLPGTSRGTFLVIGIVFTLVIGIVSTLVIGLVSSLLALSIIEVTVGDVAGSLADPVSRPG